MHIVNVKVEECRFYEEDGQHRAMLLIEGRRARVSLRAKAVLAQAAHRKEVRRLLLDDALRQLRRMPEYRNKPHAITLANGVLPG